MSELNEVVFQHETPVQLRFNDMDMLGHANNAIVQEYFDVGRVHYLKDTFTYKLWQGENTVILANINTDFIVPVFIQDDIVVKTTTLSIGTKSFKMVQHLFRITSYNVCYTKLLRTLSSCSSPSISTP